MSSEKETGSVGAVAVKRIDGSPFSCFLTVLLLELHVMLDKCAFAVPVSLSG
jgi:hypothetical protein